MNLRRYSILGFVATLTITLSSAMRGWPFPSLTAEPWLYQLSASSNFMKYGFLAVFYAGVALLGWCWWKFCQAAHHHEVTTKQVFMVFGLWVLPLVFATPLFSGDVFVYWADGQLLLRGYDPYATGVSSLGPVPMVHMIHPLWRDTSTMYGPIFLRLAEGIALLAPGSAIAGVLMFRAVAIASVLLMGVASISILKTLGRSIPQGLVFALLNPITLLHLCAGSHNDAMMLGLLFAGLAVGLKYRNWALRFLALFLCAAAGAFKIPGFAAAFVLGWLWAGEDVSIFRRLVGAAVAGVVALGAFEVQTLLTNLSWGWLNATSVPGLAHPMLSPANALAFSFGAPFDGGYGANGFTRAMATLFAVLMSAFLLIRTGRRATPEAALRAFAWALLVVAWTGPAVYPWYLSWGVALAGVVGLSSMRKPLIIGTIAVNFFVAPGGYGFLDLFSDWRHTVMAFITVAGFTAMGWYVYKRAHSAGYLSLSGPNWKANNSEVNDKPSLTSPLRMKVRN